MILAYNNSDFEVQRAFLPMSYWNNNAFRQGGSLWTKTIRHDITNLYFQNSPFLSLPAQTKTVPTSINSMPAICPSPNVWARTRPSGDYTARPAAGALAKEKVHLCKAPSCPKLLLFVLSSACPTVAQLKRQPTSVRLTQERWNECSKRQADVQKISTGCNWNGSNNLSRPSNSMNCIPVWLAGKKGGLPKTEWPTSSKGSYVGSCGIGGSKPVSYRPSGRPTHTGTGRPTCCLGSALLSQWPSAACTYRRAFALSSSDFACFWAYKASSTKKARAWPKVQTCPQAAARIAGWRCQESPRWARQSAQSHHTCVVRTTERHQTSYQEIAYRSADKHLSSGAAQWNVAQPADTTGQTYPQCFAIELHAAVGVVAVAGYLQLGQTARLAGRKMSGNAAGLGQTCLVDAGICALPDACQRPPASALGRTAQDSSRISTGRIFT